MRSSASAWHVSLQMPKPENSEMGQIFTKKKGHSLEATLSSRMSLSHLTGRGGPAVLPVGEERAVEGLSVGVVVRTGRGKEVDIVGQHSGSGVRQGDIGEVTGDEGLGRPQGTEDVQGVVAQLQAWRQNPKDLHDWNFNFLLGLVSDIR